MRIPIKPQVQFGEIDISAIVIDRKSRDDIPNILRGLKHIYITPNLRERIFKILENVLVIQEINSVQTFVDANNGRPGMEQWKILVLGVLRLGLNTDYDRLQELANQHRTIRQMLGHSSWEEDDYYYELQTLKDNIRLFTPEILDQINQEVVKEGHKLLKKTENTPLKTRADSFVVETNVHYPTDINLLWDAIRKTIETIAEISYENGITEWRQSVYQIRQFKKSYRYVQRIKHSSSKDSQKCELQREVIKNAHETYINIAKIHVAKACDTKKLLQSVYKIPDDEFVKLDEYIAHAERQINQIYRRVILGEVIPHQEKVFSIFQPHTEWISKGKMGVPVELGLPVCIVEDNHRFILHHQVMERTTDSAIAVELVDETKKRFPEIKSMSFDKGFHSKQNQIDLAERLELVVLPRKGKLSLVNKERENDLEFVHLRRKHSAVESAINALEVHGLDRCNDSGIVGFKRYVAMAVVARNIHRLGAIILAEELARRRGPYLKKAA
jgi:transposase, IS5 family